jgi:5-methylcytosine-specific restriction endonuclease McrA
VARTHGRKGRPWERIRKSVIGYAVARGTPCARCGKPIDPPGTWPDRHPMSASVDHIDPLSAGRTGGNDVANLRAMHYGCNSSRGDGSHDTVRRAW